MEGPTVQLFATCLVDALRPDVGRATVSVLEAAGCEVEFPAGQTCCGQPAFNVGLVDEARAMAEHTLDVLAGAEGSVVVPSGSCASMIVNHYPQLFQGTAREAEAEELADCTRELTQFLVDDLASDLKAACDDCVVAYHHSCHGLRELGIKEQPESLLEGVATVSPREADECCGFGGLFSIEMPAVSSAILSTKLDRLEECGADTLVGGDVSCLLHMEGGLRRRNAAFRVMHIAELLAGPSNHE